MERGQHFTWAIIQPSAVETVAHLNSAFATIAAQDIECQQYLALVQELSLCEYAEADERPVWLAFLVQPVGQLIPLPDADAYLPIWPCQLGTREPLHPGFDWPFGDCVLSTDAFFFSPVLVDKDQNPRVLPWHDSIRFKELSLADTDALIYKRIRETEARNRQEQEAAGYGSNFENWVDFSVGSTLLPVQPGNLGFPPTVGISALVSYDVIAGPNGTRNELEQDRKCIKRLLARFYQLSTERTIRWALTIQNADPNSFFLNDLNESIQELTHPVLVEFSARLERPSSPDRIQSPAPVPVPSDVDPFEELDYAYDFELEEPVMSEPKILAPHPIFDITSVRVIYFDVYDTLIDRETGIFTVLRPLLNRSSYGFSRDEALSFYFESEMEMKRRRPDAPYAEILANTYEDVALRLGIKFDATDALLFTKSVQDWPCIPDASQLLYNLARNPRLSIVAISDVDHDFLLQTRAFASLAAFYEAVFTWDVCHAYKPDLAVFDAPLRYYDAQGVPRAHSYLVSGSLLGDLEPAREVGVPAVWMRYPGSLATNLYSVEDASPAGSFISLSDLWTSFLQASGPHLIYGDPWPMNISSPLYDSTMLMYLPQYMV